jgi:ribosomal protein S19E (S16A)
MVSKLEKENVKSIEPQQKAEAEWKELCNTMMNHTLIPQTDSWWYVNGPQIFLRTGEMPI